MSYPQHRLVIVVRADPVICGHSGEARNLAEVALTRGFDDVRLLTWPIPTLEAAGLPLKPLDRLQPYSHGITVERPEAVGDGCRVGTIWRAAEIAANRRIAAKGYPNQDGPAQPSRDQRQRVRQHLHDHRRDGSPAEEIAAEIALQDHTNEVGKPDRDRLIESHFNAESCDCFGCRPRPEGDGRGIAWEHVDESEQDRHGDEADEQGEPDPLDGVDYHRVPLLPERMWRPPIRRRLRVAPSCCLNAA